MSRPVSYPATLSITCRRCKKSYAPQFYRRNSKTCSACLDGTDPPSPEENHPYVPAGHREKRRIWPEGVVFTGELVAAPRPETCTACGADLPAEPEPGPGRPREHCCDGCRMKAHRQQKRSKLLGKKSKNGGKKKGRSPRV